jgi:predicted acetyltransferase
MIKMKVDLIEAKEEDLPIVLNLIKYYVYDMSKMTGWDCTPQGNYNGCNDSREYWQSNHPDTHVEYRWSENQKGHPFMIYVDGKIAGFVLLQELYEEGKTLYDVGEFFVLGKFQKLGVGRQIARKLFKRFRGSWRLQQIPENTPTVKFWIKVIGEFTDGNFKESLTDEMITQTFQT